MRYIVLTLVLMSSTALAEPQLGSPGAAQGIWLPWRVDVSGYPQFAVSPSDRKAFAAQLDAIAAVVKASPALRDLPGLYPELTGSLRGAGGPPFKESQWKTAPLLGSILLAVWTDKQVDRAGSVVSVKEKWRYNGPASLVISINNPFEPNHEAWMEDERGTFYPFREGPRIGDFTVQFDHIVVAKPDKPSLYVPVSRERLINAWIKHVEPTARTVPEYRRQSDEARALLARMDEAERQAPAWRRNRGSALGLVAPGTPDSSVLVEVNREFFDPTLPRTAVQVILVRTDPHLSQRVAGTKLLSALASMAVIEQTDWRTAPVK